MPLDSCLDGNDSAVREDNLSNWPHYNLQTESPRWQLSPSQHNLFLFEELIFPNL